VQEDQRASNEKILESYELLNGKSRDLANSISFKNQNYEKCAEIVQKLQNYTTIVNEKRLNLTTYFADASEEIRNLKEINRIRKNANYIHNIQDFCSSRRDFKTEF
jgi:hypothetical protein